MKSITTLILLVVVNVAHARYFDRSALYDDEIIRDLVTPNDYGVYRDGVPDFGKASNGKPCLDPCSLDEFFWMCKIKNDRGVERRIKCSYAYDRSTTGKKCISFCFEKNMRIIVFLKVSIAHMKCPQRPYYY